MFSDSQSPKKFRFTFRRPDKQPGNSSVAGKVVPIVFMLVGAIFFAVGVMFVYLGQQFTKASVETEMTVVLMDRKRSDNGYVYRPTFEALSPDGQLIEYTGSVWVNPKPHNEGDVVDGRANWETGELRSDKMIKSGGLMGAIFSGVGFFVFLIGLGIALWRRRKAPQTF